MPLSITFIMRCLTLLVLRNRTGEVQQVPTIADEQTTILQPPKNIKGRLV